MYAIFIAALAATNALAAPVAIAERATPNHYSEGYLEPYATYHARYLSIGCSGKQGTTFFSDCCRPLLASQTVAANQPAYCASGFSASPSVQQSTSTSSSAAAAVSAPGHAGIAAAVAQPSTSSSTVASPSASPSPSPSPSPSSTKSSKPAQSSSAAPSSGGGQSGDYQYKGGFATFFTQNGNAGACGQVHQDSELGIAIDGNGFWQNYGVVSPYCGKYINIKNTQNGKTVKAQVWDVCPTCTNDNSLDLSVGAFNAIATPSEGMVPIEWSFA